MKLNQKIFWREKEVHFFFFSVFCIVFNRSWQLTMFARKQKSCVNGIQLVTDDGLCNRKAYHKVETVFIFPVSSNYFV